MSTVSILNTDAGLSGKTVADLESTQAVTGAKSFNRAPSAPFVVQAGSAKVTNLDADLLDGQEGTYYTNASNLVSGFVPAARSNLVATLADGATPALNASLGNTFLLTAAGNRTIAIPTNPASGQKITIVHKASGADRTLALNTGAGGFRFGTDIAALTATTSTKTDYIGCIYNAADDKWDVVAVVKGY